MGSAQDEEAVAQLKELSDMVIETGEGLQLVIDKMIADRALADASVKTKALVEAARKAQQMLVAHEKKRARTLKTSEGK